MTGAALVPEFAVTDAVKSHAFYTEILGFDVAYARPSQGFYYLTLGAAEIMIEQLSDSSWLADTATPPFGRGMHLQIQIADLDPLLARCAAADITLFRQPETAWYKTSAGYSGQRQCILSEPDGYLLRFSQSLGCQGDRPTSGRIVEA